MCRIVLDMQGGLFAEAIMKALTDSDPDFSVYVSAKPGETVSLCRTCHANVLVMEVARSGTRKLSERIKLLDELRSRESERDCKTLLLVDEKADEMLAADVRQAVKDHLVDNFIYASVSPTYLAGVIDAL